MEKVEFLEKTLKLGEKEEAKKDFTYPQVMLVTKEIPKIGEKLDYLEKVLGLSEEDKKKDGFFHTYPKMKSYLERYLPQFGERLDYVEEILNIKNKDEKKK